MRVDEEAKLVKKIGRRLWQEDIEWRSEDDDENKAGSDDRKKKKK